jgi:hypothetical protein
MKLHPLGLGLFALTALSINPAAACTVIASIPAVLTQPGTYCLASDHTFAAAAGNAITIASDDVSIDCRQQLITGTAGTATLAVGVAAMNRSNITVRNCKIGGFHSGIRINEDGTLPRRPSGTVVESNQLIRNTQLGILVATNGSIVRDNLVFATGGNTLGLSTAGIRVRGSVDVARNDVQSPFGPASGPADTFGIFATHGNGGVIENNLVRSIASSRAQYGIAVFAPGGAILRNNTLHNRYYSATNYEVAYACIGSRTVIEGNTSYGFANGQVNCEQLAGNTFILGDTFTPESSNDQGASK